MRQIVLVLILLASAFHCAARDGIVLYYEAEKDTVLLDSDPERPYFNLRHKVAYGGAPPWDKKSLYESRKIADIKKGERLQFTFGNSYELFSYVQTEADPEYLSLVEVTTADGVTGKAVLDDLTLCTEQPVPEELISGYDPDNRWICSYYYDILKSGSRDMLLAYNPDRDSVYGRPAGFALTDKALQMQGYNFGWMEFLVVSAETSGNDVRLTVVMDDDSSGLGIWNGIVDVYQDRFRPGLSTLLFRKNGDGWDVFLDGEPDTPLMTVVKTNQLRLIDRALWKLDHGEAIDTSDIIFPEHVDSAAPPVQRRVQEETDTSDSSFSEHTDSGGAYENAETVVSVNMFTFTDTEGIYEVSENLRLRENQDTSSASITTMQAGTLVKILSVGKEETIDGIKSSWVQIEVQRGAKDKDGNTIQAGTTGWCFGGYLYEAEIEGIDIRVRSHAEGIVFIIMCAVLTASLLYNVVHIVTVLKAKKTNTGDRGTVSISALTFISAGCVSTAVFVICSISFIQYFFFIGFALIPPERRSYIWIVALFGIYILYIAAGIATIIRMVMKKKETAGSLRAAAAGEAVIAAGIILSIIALMENFSILPIIILFGSIAAGTMLITAGATAQRQKPLT